MQEAGSTRRFYVSFSAEVNANTTEALIAVMFDCVAKGATEIYLMLSTPGGEVARGITLYNTLRALPVNLITHNVGNVDSIGNVIFLAGKQRYACHHSTFMFHGVGFNLDPGTRLEEKLLRERIDGIVADHKRIGDIIAEASNLNGDEVAELFMEARTKDAAYAASHGIVHEIMDVEIPPGSPIISLVFKR